MISILENSSTQHIDYLYFIAIIDDDDDHDDDDDDDDDDDSCCKCVLCLTWFDLIWLLIFNT